MFWGRTEELAELRCWDKKTPRLVVLYGRRRVGKTCLVETAFAGQRICKIDGLEGGSVRDQQRVFLHAMAGFFQKPSLMGAAPESWTAILELLSDLLGDEPCVLFLDEFQWLAGERTRLVSEFKYVWDNKLSKRNKVCTVLCGSISSFMVNRVMRSRALYGRVDLEIDLHPLTIDEIRDPFLAKRSLEETLEYYMAVGGVPQYLCLFDFSKSVRLNLDKLFFSRQGYLLNEYERIFASHFGTNRHYRNILLEIAARGSASRNEIQTNCGLQPGGRLAEYLRNLETAGFVEKYAPIDRPNAERVCRYRIIDHYLLFYFHFIYKRLRQIKAYRGDNPALHFLPDSIYLPWQGQAFERICLAHRHTIAKVLGFGGVLYEAGSWFGRGGANRGIQLDLVFKRADRVLTICELKYRGRKVGLEAAQEMQQKLEVFPNPWNYTIERVLISRSSPTETLVNNGYFHRILQIGDIWS